MKEKNTKCIITNKVLIQKLNLEGRAKDNNIEKVLSFKKPKPLTINPKLLNNNKFYNDPENNKNQAYNEALRIIHNFNSKFKNNIKNYNIKKEENINFLKGYNKYKKVNKKINIEEIEKKNYIFGGLINAYSKKGIKVPNQFFYNDIYKESGLLLCEKSKMDDFFEQEVKNKGGKSRKGAKSMRFLQKLSNEVQKVFRKRLLSCKEQKKENASISYENESMKNPVRNRTKMEKADYFYFFDKINSNLEQMKKEEKEIQKLKELITIEENENQLSSNKKYNGNNNSMSNIYNNSNNYLESYNNYSKNNRKANKYRGDDKWNRQNNSNNNSNSYNNNEICTSSTMIPKNNNISYGYIINEKIKKNSLGNLDNINLHSSSLDENNINIQNFITNKKILNNRKNNISNIDISQEQENKGLSIRLKPSKRTSTIKIIPLNNPKLVPPIYIDKIKSRRKSFLPIANFSFLNTVENHNTSTTDKINTNKSNPSISLRKVNSQPNILKDKKHIKEIYDSITKISFHPFKKFRNEEKINSIYKSFYGEQIKIFENNANNKKDLLRNYYNIKRKIIQNEINDNIYSKYKELLPNIMVNNIRKNNVINERLKEQPLNFAKALYKNEYLDFNDKND